MPCHQELRLGRTPSPARSSSLPPDPQTLLRPDQQHGLRHPDLRCLDIPVRNIFGTLWLRGSRALDHLVRAARVAGLRRVRTSPGDDRLRAQAAGGPDPAVLLGRSGDEPGVLRARPTRRRGLVTASLVGPGRRDRRYRISAAGLERLRDWQTGVDAGVPGPQAPGGPAAADGSTPSPDAAAAMLDRLPSTLWPSGAPSWSSRAGVPRPTAPSSPTRPWSPTGASPTTTARTRSSAGCRAIGRLTPADRCRPGSPARPAAERVGPVHSSRSPTRSILTP